ncbi:hypothetical protein ACHAPY_000076 [Fusarium culmorum]
MRSAYSFQIAENSLSGMGIERRPGTAASLSASPSESIPDVGSERGSLPPRDIDVLPSLGAVEIQRLLELYREEIVTVYPFLEVDDLSRIVTSVLESPEENTLKEIQAIKLVVATALAVEAHGQNNLSKRLIDEVEPVICSVSGEAFIDILELQLMVMLSIYWFYCGEELLAWRAIGIAGRETNEIGLHRRASLMENFKDPQERDLALRCFCYPSRHIIHISYAWFLTHGYVPKSGKNSPSTHHHSPSQKIKSTFLTSSPKNGCILYPMTYNLSSHVFPKHRSRSPEHYNVYELCFT